MFRPSHLTHALARAFVRVAKDPPCAVRAELLLLVAAVFSAFAIDTAAAQSPGVEGIRFIRAFPLESWREPPPILQMQGIWRGRDRVPGAFTMVIVHGTRMAAFVERGGRDSLLAEVEARAYVSTDSASSMMEVTRLTGVFATDSAEIELTLVLKRHGRLDVDHVVRYRGFSSKWDRWYRYEFRGGQPMPMMERMVKADIPDFPWPPPRASMRAVVLDTLVTRAGATETCGAIFDRLSSALFNAGYLGPSVYGIPNDDGFVVVTRLENIREDGFPLADRFTLDPRPDRPRTLKEFIATLFKAPPGLYRVLVFAVTSGVVTESDTEPSREDANRWLNKGSQILTTERREKPLPGAHCEALIYEFRKPSQGDAALFTDNLSVFKHLACGGLWRDKLP